MRKYEITVNDMPYSIEVKTFSSEEAELEVNNKQYSVKIGDIINTEVPVIRKPVTTIPPEEAAVTSSAPKLSGASGAIATPIPGVITDLFVKEGDAVIVGQKLFKIEAMKMENVINSTIAGTVKKIVVSVNDSLVQGQDCIVIE
jgi:glutaconyl-CoA/methylmalonyl-CoA decarboxylase subunit gamma